MPGPGGARRSAVATGIDRQDLEALREAAGVPGVVRGRGLRASTAPSSSERATRAGAPTISELSGNSLPSVTSALAPTIEFRPIFAPLRTVAPMPTSELSPIVQPWTMAAWPMVQPAPMVSGKPHVAVQDAVVLDVGVVADRHPLVVAADDGAEPDANVAAEPDAADDMRAGRDEVRALFGQFGPVALERVDRHAAVPPSFAQRNLRQRGEGIKRGGGALLRDGLQHRLGHRLADTAVVGPRVGIVQTLDHRFGVEAIGAVEPSSSSQVTGVATGAPSRERVE